MGIRKNSKMEEVCARFPLLAENIFKRLAPKSLTNCKEVSRKLQDSLKSGKVLWKQMILKSIKGK